MRLIASPDAETLVADEKMFSISNRLKTLRDGTRKATEVVTTIPDKLPYDPQPFPKGLWKITGVHWQKEKHFDYRTFGPVKLLTNAWQMVETWETDENGDYLRPSGKRVRDTGYLLHYSQFSTTLGCIRLASPETALALAMLVQAAFEDGETVELEVV